MTRGGEGRDRLGMNESGDDKDDSEDDHGVYLVSMRLPSFSDVGGDWRVSV